MKLTLHNLRGRAIRQVDVRDDVFGVPMNSALVHQTAVSQQSNARQGTAATKTRSQVSGGGAKPRPQKHTGRARQGSIRAPHWKGGGVVFGPTGRSYRRRTPKRMRRQSLVAMLSDKVRGSQLLLVEDLELEERKTKELLSVLNSLGSDSSVLLVADGADEAVLRCARNIPKLKMLPAALLNPVDLLNHKSVVMTLAAVRRAEELWGGPFVRRGSSAGMAAGG